MFGTHGQDILRHMKERTKWTLFEQSVIYSVFMSYTIQALVLLCTPYGAQGGIIGTDGLNTDNNILDVKRLH